MNEAAAGGWFSEVVDFVPDPLVVVLLLRHILVIRLPFEHSIVQEW
jgi:hypothetical protein